MIGTRHQQRSARDSDTRGSGAYGPAARDACLESELLIKEARRRQHRRWAATVGVIAGAGGLVVGLLFGMGGGSRNIARSSGLGTPKVVSFRSLTFPGPFVPLQVVSADGKAWVEGTNTANYQDGCSLEAVDPATLQQTRIRLPACGTYVTTGGGLIYLAADVPVGKAGSDQFHLEVFNPATRQATLLSPVITTTVGSSRAHMDLTYQDGWIWMSEWGSKLWKISPGTGRVVSTIGNAPPSAGGHGIIVGNRGGLWITPGTASPAAIYRIAPGSQTISTVYTGPKGSSVLWLATVDTKVWAAIADYGANGAIAGTSLKAFGFDGTQVLSTGYEQFGDIPLVGNTTQAWSVGSGPQCASPQRLWFIDPKTGRSTSITTLATPIEPCLTENPTGSQVALVNSTVLILEATGTTRPSAILYSIRTQSH